MNTIAFECWRHVGFLAAQTLTGLWVLIFCIDTAGDLGSGLGTTTPMPFILTSGHQIPPAFCCHFSNSFHRINHYPANRLVTVYCHFSCGYWSAVMLTRDHKGSLCGGGRSLWLKIHITNVLITFGLLPVIIWLALWAGKKNQISCCDWQARWSYLPRSGYGLCTARKIYHVLVFYPI